MAVLNIKGHEVLVDDEDVFRIQSINWCVSGMPGRRYFYNRDYTKPCNGKRFTDTSMHRMLADCSGNMSVDHINGNTLDNRKSNLRVCTQAENSRNQSLKKCSTSSLKGASFCRKNGKWLSQITLNRKNIYLGYFSTKEEAHLAYCEASKKYHGEFARTK